MKQKTKIQLTAVALLFNLSPTAVYAQQMVVQTQLGSDAYNLSNIAKVLVKKDGMSVVERAKNAKTYSYPQIMKITFHTATSLTTPKASPSNFKVKVEDGGNAISWTGTKGEQVVTLFDITGKIISQATRQTSQRMDISDLPHGIYVLKVGNNSIKFSK